MVNEESELSNLLGNGIQQLGLERNPVAEAVMITHLLLLRKWNRSFNLTAIDNPKEIVVRHLLDSLSVAPWIRGSRILDIGSGAGFPGLPLAALRPDRHFTLLDSRGKKIRFIDTVVRSSGIKNVQTVQNRLQQFRSGNKFDTLVARAFASLTDLYLGCRHLLGPGTRLLAMKGEVPEAEVNELGNIHGLQCRIERLQVPFLDASRNLVIIEV